MERSRHVNMHQGMRDDEEWETVYLSELSGISFTIFVGFDFFRGDGAII